MHLTTILILSLAILGILGANARNRIIPNPNTALPTKVERYPICLEDYDTHCCMTAEPISNGCKRGKCTNKPGWTYASGLGKVESIKYCLTEVGGNDSSFCKKPGYKNVGSIIRWTGQSFDPMLRSPNYRRYLRPGM
ncbi:uncharacterized protein BCR38DRAFT_507377 [Pseudomassariella vexata]|uniref:Extracellular membrane protein CFEM domain-containing protein n=1 Tax=Pseudomassariella vexata TaxID=1141098 RepID=A0A1Y2EA71_9PEZI|nr:uncharacterized protein BCR38DRAFT_507377 [Pseudomassariella vexata]ORY68471.1 hypothetical protein BCR38DRAFT_507377 [Pseudomassariella vexata]